MAQEGIQCKLASLISGNLVNPTSSCCSTENIMLQRPNIDTPIMEVDCLSLINPGAKL